MKNLYILLIHGTWAGAGRWTHPQSSFRQNLERALEALGYNVRFECYPWNGRNRWGARAKVAAEVQKHLCTVVSERDRHWEFLIVGHSHAGNIATEAVRDELRYKPSLPIRGVVCLNTPFLKQETRGSGVYLTFWLLIALVLFATLLLGAKNATGSINVPILGEALFSQLRVTLLWALGSLAVIIFALRIASRRVQNRPFSWGPRPHVLCLSCADDEAITFLGLGEGISNLPQLLLHPLVLGLAATMAMLFLFQRGCNETAVCWAQQLASAGVLFTIWVAVALIGGTVGACAVTLMFGLSFWQGLKSLVSRVLVAYVPLQPAQSFFQPISPKLRWRRPIELLHSAILSSPQTVDAICAWLKETPSPIKEVQEDTDDDF